MELQGSELWTLIQRVFSPRTEDRSLAVLVDLPDDRLPDNPQWKKRRRMAAGWVEALNNHPKPSGQTLSTRLFLFENVGLNNADLPDLVLEHSTGPLPASVEALPKSGLRPLHEVLAEHRLVMAMTEFSATAPLKLKASDLGFRGATMPGFSQAMIPALRLDYQEINRRVSVLCRLLDQALAAEIRFEVDGETPHRLRLDLRFRKAHLSGGLFPEPGMVGNLPSGEAYIVPYEGEQPNEPSRSEGELPVQLGEEVVLYQVHRNRAIRVISQGPVSEEERARLAREPAYGNLSELGLGVLDDFGIEPCGELLLDEKLGLHIAFGRSDHFGGQVGARDFSSPREVVHIDRVYVPTVQPRVFVRTLDLELPEGKTLPLMRDHRYAIDFAAPPSP